MQSQKWEYPRKPLWKLNFQTTTVNGAARISALIYLSASGEVKKLKNAHWVGFKDNVGDLIDTTFQEDKSKFRHMCISVFIQLDQLYN